MIGPDITERRIVLALDLGRPLAARELALMLSVSITAVRNALRWCLDFGAVERVKGRRRYLYRNRSQS